MKVFPDGMVRAKPLRDIANRVAGCKDEKAEMVLIWSISMGIDLIFDLW
jgi:hypothetical protein